jgi:hypothetical protein
VFVASLAPDGGKRAWIPGMIVATLVFAALFFVLARGDARWRRAAGVAAVVSTAFAAFAVQNVADVVVRSDPTLGMVLTALAAIVVAMFFRVVLASLLTQFAVLASVTTLVGAVANLVRDAIFGAPSFDSQTAVANPTLQVIFQGVWWAALAVGLGVMALHEADGADDDAARRRASLTRLWAGLTLAIGISTAVTQTGLRSTTDFVYARFIEPWIGEVALLVVAIALVERAFRRDSGAYLVGGIVALVIALTDFNTSYLTDSIQAALLVEGVILLGIGFGANRLRTTLDRRRAAALTSG